MEVIQISLLGGLFALDATAVGQFMISRPLVVGVVLGAVIGDPVLGASIGTLLELYLLVSFPTGGSRFPEGSTATVVAVASASGLAAPDVIPLSVAVGLLWGQLGGATITWMRRANSRLMPEPDRLPGGTRQLGLMHLGAILMDFLRGTVVTLVGVLVGREIVGFVAGPWMLSHPASVGLLLVGGSVSLGILLRDLGGFRRRKTLFAAGLALGVIGAGLI